jgi:hypothetical protein
MSRSINEILDFNNDGKVDNEEKEKGKELGVLDNDLDIQPFGYWLMKYGVPKKKIKKKKGKKILKLDNIELIQHANASYNEYVNLFNTKF